MCEEAGNGVREIERGQIAVPVPVALHRDADDRDAVRGAAAQGDFAETCGMAIPLAIGAEGMTMALRHP